MNERKEYKLSKSHSNREMVVRFPVKITALQGQARLGQGRAVGLRSASVDEAEQLQTIRSITPCLHCCPSLCCCASAPLQYVALERPLPFAIRPDFSPKLLPQKGTVYESGIEGVTFNFRWAFYG